MLKQNLSCQIKLGDDITEDGLGSVLSMLCHDLSGQRTAAVFELGIFKQFGQTMADKLMLAQAHNAHGDIVACSLFFR